MILGLHVLRPPLAPAEWGCTISSYSGASHAICHYIPQVTLVFGLGGHRHKVLNGCGPVPSVWKTP